MRSLSKNSKTIQAVVLMLVFCGALFFLQGCKKETPEVPPVPVLDGGVYILCEGNYQWGNGRVDHLRFSDNTYTEDVFKSVNDRPLGDVVQSIKVHNGRGYIVVNNSGKIEVVELAGFTSTGTINGLTSPRYILPINNTTAYISDLYSNKVSIADLNNLQVTGSIPINGSTEEMVLVGETVYITNTRTSWLYLVNSVSNTLSDSIAIGFAANSIVKDKNGKLWILCAGSETQSLSAGIYCVDPATNLVIRHFDLGVYLQIWDKLRMNGSQEQLYYLNSGVWRMDIAATSLPSAPFITQQGRLFHGLGIDPLSGNIYVSDAVDYVQRGKIYRYREDGSAIDSMTSGIIPTEFYFY